MANGNSPKYAPIHNLYVANLKVNLLIKSNPILLSFNKKKKSQGRFSYKKTKSSVRKNN